MYKILLTLVMMSPLVALAQNVMPITLCNGDIIVQTYSMDFDVVKVQIDTGAKTSVVFRRSLLRNEKKARVSHMRGLGDRKLTVSRSGILNVIGFTTVANYIDIDYEYDVILGLDWMVAHNAVINLQTLTLEYY